MSTCCTSCQAEFDASVSDVCPKCGRSAASGPAEQGLVFRAERPKRPGSAKVVISVDGTGSTGRYAEVASRIVERALRTLESMIARLDIDAWQHGDEEYGEQPVKLVGSASVDQAVGAIRGIDFRGGGDSSETHSEQIQRLIDVSAWGPRSNSRNILLLVLTDDTKPLRSGKSMRQLGEEIKAKHVKLFLVCQSTPSLRELVDAAGGFLIEISTDPDDPEIKRVMNSLCATLTATVSAAGGTIPMPVAKV